MTRLPLAILHRKLEELALAFPDRKTFREFRAPAWMVEAETEALEHAESVVTPHLMLASLFPTKTRLLQWQLPPARQLPAGDCVVFPGPSVARKGAYELRDCLRTLRHPLLVVSSAAEESRGFWNDLRLVHTPGDWLERAAVVVQPAFIENNPRPLLRALAAGIRVIATSECGLPPHPNLTLVTPGKVAELTNAIQATTLACAHHPQSPQAAFSGAKN
jgi:hypothetical protein